MFFKLSKLKQKANIANTILSKIVSIHECRKQIFGTNLAKTAAIWYINFSLLCVFVISYEGNEIGVDSKETQWRWLLNDKKFLPLEWAKHLSQVCFQTSCSCLLFLELVKLLWAKENNEWNFLLCLQRIKTFQGWCKL